MRHHSLGSLLGPLFLMTLVQGAAKPPETATDIVGHVQKNLMPGEVVARYKFKNTRTDGTTNEYEVRMQSKDINHAHSLFVEPQREKGREVLRVDDNIWTYAPTVGRVMRIADRDSFAGGDFSNADILRIDWLAQYDAKMAKETPKQWIIDLQAKTKDAPYAKMRLWVDKQRRQPVQQTYYDAQGTLLKRCLYGSIQKFGSVERPSHLLMENVITKQKSELWVLDLKVEKALPASRFVVDNLGK